MQNSLADTPAAPAAPVTPKTAQPQPTGAPAAPRPTQNSLAADAPPVRTEQNSLASPPVPPVPPTPSDTDPKAAPPKKSGGKGRIWIPVCAAILLLLLAAGLGAWLIFGGDEPSHMDRPGASSSPVDPDDTPVSPTPERDEPTAAPTEDPSAAATAEPTPAASEVPAPTATPAPTPTPAPTATPAPTPTPAPTATPAPTPTPTPTPAPTPTPSASAVQTGTCGSGLTWALGSDGTLTISGMGKMDSYSSGGAPWYAYRGQITTVSLPEGLSAIGTHAFQNCSQLRTVNIPNTVTTIGAYSFSHCNLESVVISKFVTNIGSCAFASNPNMQGIWVTSANSHYANDEMGMLYVKTKAVLVQCPGGYSGSFTVPSSVAAISASAFQGCTKVTDIYILNANCQVADAADTLGSPITTTIHGYAGSKAQLYAQKYGYTFVVAG